MFYDIAKKSEVELDLILEPCQKIHAQLLSQAQSYYKKIRKINNGDSVVAFFCPADHFLSDSKNLLRTILKAAYFTDKESIFVVGIPSLPKHKLRISKFRGQFRK